MMEQTCRSVLLICGVSVFITKRCQAGLFCYLSVCVVGGFGDSRVMQVHDHGHSNTFYDFQAAYRCD